MHPSDDGKSLKQHPQVYKSEYCGHHCSEELKNAKASLSFLILPGTEGVETSGRTYFPKSTRRPVIQLLKRETRTPSHFCVLLSAGCSDTTCLGIVLKPPATGGLVLPPKSLP